MPILSDAMCLWPFIPLETGWLAVIMAADMLRASCVSVTSTAMNRSRRRWKLGGQTVSTKTMCVHTHTCTDPHYLRYVTKLMLQPLINKKNLIIAPSWSGCLMKKALWPPCANISLFNCILELSISTRWWSHPAVTQLWIGGVQSPSLQYKPQL